jgi:hypothetical protein
MIFILLLLELLLLLFGKGDLETENCGHAWDVFQLLAWRVETWEDYSVTSIFFDIFGSVIVNDSFFEIFGVEQMIANEESMNCLHIDAFDDIFFSVCN